MFPATPFLDPPKLWSRSELLARPSPIPKAPGVYAFYYRGLLPEADTIPCHTHHGFTLLYIGIAPTKPPENGARPSSQHLRKRLQCHLRGNAEGSSLRLSVGCILAQRLGLELRRVGSGTRLTFAAGEPTLSAWLESNARVTWTEHQEPWLLESELIHSLALPLNLDQNESHPFHPQLTMLRADARARARSLPVLPG